mmetsp:Transcript_2854/g.8947  ORF Transcript_2854/g.8947 Transcript_2854/m.8947 type:complete len:380 (+) Transcript_2854:79-1218(+)
MSGAYDSSSSSGRSRGGRGGGRGRGRGDRGGSERGQGRSFSSGRGRGSRGRGSEGRGGRGSSGRGRGSRGGRGGGTEFGDQPRRRVVKHSVGILELAAKESGGRRYVSEKEKASKVRAIKAKRRFALEQEHEHKRPMKHQQDERQQKRQKNEDSAAAPTNVETGEPPSFYDRFFSGELEMDEDGNVINTLTGEIEGDPMAEHDLMHEPSERELAGITGNRSRLSGDVSSSSDEDQDDEDDEDIARDYEPEAERSASTSKDGNATATCSSLEMRGESGTQQGTAAVNNNSQEQQQKQQKQVGEPSTTKIRDPFAKAKQRNEERLKAIEARIQEKKDRKQRNRESIHRRRRERAFLEKRSRRGQPVMNNVVRHLLSRIEKQ